LLEYSSSTAQCTATAEVPAERMATTERELLAEEELTEFVRAPVGIRITTIAIARH